MNGRPWAEVGRLTVLMLALVFVSACASEGERSQPRVWIDAPLDGSQLELRAINVLSHSSCESGTREVALLVNGVEYRRDAPDDTSASLVRLVQSWVPPAEGQYTLQVIAYARGRVSSDPATVHVTIGAPSGASPPTAEPAIPASPLPEATAIPAAPGSEPAAPTSTPAPAAPTSTPPAPTATLAPAAPTAAPRPPEIAYFEAYPSSISVGACAELRWGVDYAEAVWLNGEGVGDHETRQVCPNVTTTYVIEARSAGGQQQASVTVSVSEPPTSTPVPDTSGPEIVNIQESADPIYTSYPGGCDPTEVTITARVTDPSGVQEVRLRYKLGSGGWEGPLFLSVVSGDRYRVTLPVQPNTPTTIQYQVLAKDTLGNQSSVEQGTVEVTQCTTG
jgi:hypothetical protein